MDNNLPGHTYDLKVVVRVYVALLVLAGAMVVLSLTPIEKLPLTWIDLGVAKVLAIFAIATLMCAIVSGFLMGLKYEKSKLNTVVFLGNFAFLGLFVVFTWSDIGFRGLMDPSFTKQINWESPVIKANQAPHAPVAGATEAAAHDATDPVQANGSTPAEAPAADADAAPAAAH